MGMSKKGLAEHTELNSLTIVFNCSKKHMLLNILINLQK
jgi:hypothetical protein